MSNQGQLEGKAGELQKRGQEARAAAVLLGYGAAAKVAVLQQAVGISEKAGDYREQVETMLALELGADIIEAGEKGQRKWRVVSLLERWEKLAYVQLACADRVQRAAESMEKAHGDQGRKGAGGTPAGGKEGLSRAAVERVGRAADAAREAIARGPVVVAEEPEYNEEGEGHGK